ncbi:MAG: VOC family protein [Chloroflexota bacterium]|nr:VOC family protein [Chloroflexota bacterium]
MATGFQVTFDCADPDGVARFWASALGYRIQDPPAGFDSWEAFLASQGVPEADWNKASAVIDPDGHGPRLYFQRVPEGKVVKNRVHLDLNVSGPRERPLDERLARIRAESERLRAEGAVEIRPLGEENGDWWTTLQDPEGNEFCLQ